MKELSSGQIRQMFLDFFQEKGHTIEPSASLIPVDDPTLLWINLGVATMKKYFDGSVVPKNPRMTSSQKSIRTNDIENVGKTPRHHTLFEMLGNFSVGDYFKEEAIAWAFELLTSPKWFGWDKDKLYMTVYPKDTDAKKFWKKSGFLLITSSKLKTTSGILAKAHPARTQRFFMIVVRALTTWPTMIRKTIRVVKMTAGWKFGTLSFTV